MLQLRQQRRQLVERPADADRARGRALAGGGENLGRTTQLGQQGGELHHRARSPRRPQGLGQPGPITLGDASPGRLPTLVVEAQGGEHLLGQAQVAQIHRHLGSVGETDRVEGRRAQGHDLDVAARAGDARQLHAGLDDLALRARPLVQTNHRAFVRQPQGTGLVAEAGGDQPGDLGGDVRGQGHHLARAGLDEADGRRPPHAAQAQGQHVLVFEGRGDDPGEAPAIEHPQQRLGDPTPRGGRLRGEVPHARGQA